MTHAFAALRKTKELIADQQVGEPSQAVPKRGGGGLVKIYRWLSAH
jgi:hypothetical protein